MHIVSVAFQSRKICLNMALMPLKGLMTNCVLRSSPSETGYEDTQRTDHHPSLICPLHSFKEPKAVLVSQEASGDAGQLRVRRSDASDCTAERRVESDGHRESSDPVEKGSAGIQQKPADEAIRQTEYLANTRIPAQGWIQACR